MISNSSKYAIKGVLYLAIHSNEQKKIMVKCISESINVPNAYLAKLLQELSRQNIISSTRGPKGGFYLSDENKNQPLINIVTAIEGTKRLESCVLNLKACDLNKPCPMHKLYSPAKAILVRSLTNKIIKDIAEDIATGKSFLPI